MLKCGAPIESVLAGIQRNSSEPGSDWLLAEPRSSNSESSSELTCYAPEGGNPSERHFEAFPNNGHLKLMERFEAASANAKTYRMVFRPNGITVTMDTRETIKIACGALATFLLCGQAANNLVLVFATPRFDVINVDCDIWTTFTRNTSSVFVSGTLHPEELRRFIETHKHPSTVNILNQRFLRSGSLVDFCRLIPPNVTTFVYDSRCTSNSYLIENVMALYGDLFLRKRNSSLASKSSSSSLLISRLAEMLKDDAPAYAAVLTMMPGDDVILQTLLGHNFKRARPGYLCNMDRCYEKFDYWRSSVNNKTIIFGFLDPNVGPVPEANGAVI
uniref:Uncharacterized protein n=1 Tax=Panagrolaimus superbus TaxID=310955 RepID=A0A914Y7U1_9BILA